MAASSCDFRQTALDLIDNMKEFGYPRSETLSSLENLTQDRRDLICVKLTLPLGLSAQGIVDNYFKELCPRRIISWLVELDSPTQLDRYLESKPYDSSSDTNDLISTSIFNEGRSCGLEVFDVLVRHRKVIPGQDFMSFVRLTKDETPLFPGSLNFKFEREKVIKMAWSMTTKSLDHVIKIYSEDNWWRQILVEIREQRRRPRTAKSSSQ